VGDASDGGKLLQSFESEENVGVLRREVNRLEVKVSGLTSELERQTKELEGVKEEVFLFHYFVSCYVIYFVLYMVVFSRRLRRTLADIVMNNICKICSLIEVNDVVFHVPDLTQRDKAFVATVVGCVHINLWGK